MSWLSQNLSRSWAKWAVVGCFVHEMHMPQPRLVVGATRHHPGACTPSRTCTQLPCGLVLKHRLVWKCSMMWLRAIRLCIVWQEEACGTLIMLAWCLFSSFTSFDHLCLRLLTEIHLQNMFTCNPWPHFYSFWIIKLPFSGTGPLMKVNIHHILSIWCVIYPFTQRESAGSERHRYRGSAQATIVEASALSDKLVKVMGWIHLITGKCIRGD